MQNICETKTSNSLIAFFVMASSSSSQFLWDLAPLSRHHCIKNFLPMKIYPYLSYRRKINETDVNYTCNLQKVLDSSDSLNGNRCSLFMFIRSTIPMISGDFLTRWNSITVRKGREKGQFLGISYFWIEVLGLNYLTKEPPSFPTFQVKARLYVNFIAVRKYNFLDYFLFCFVLCTISLL